jgi:hypothetical protein
MMKHVRWQPGIALPEDTVHRGEEFFSLPVPFFDGCYYSIKISITIINYTSSFVFFKLWRRNRDQLLSLMLQVVRIMSGNDNCREFWSLKVTDRTTWSFSKEGE